MKHLLLLLLPLLDHCKFTPQTAPMIHLAPDTSKYHRVWHVDSLNVPRNGNEFRGARLQHLIDSAEAMEGCTILLFPFGTHSFTSLDFRPCRGSMTLGFDTAARWQEVPPGSVVYNDTSSQ